MKFISKVETILISFFFLVAPSYIVAISAEEVHLPFEQVVQYLQAEESNTTLQNDLLAKRLTGKTFEGEIKVSDVGGSPELPEIYADYPELPCPF